MTQCLPPDLFGLGVRHDTGGIARYGTGEPEQRQRKHDSRDAAADQPAYAAGLRQSAA